MVDIPKSKRLVPVETPVASSGNLPQPSFARVQLAGATAKGIAGIGDVLNKIGVQQQATQDNLDAQNLLTRKQGEFSQALIEADKIADAGEYKKAIDKSIKKISSSGVNFGFLQNARIGGQVRAKLDSLKQSAIIKSLARTSAKQNDGFNANYKEQVNSILEAALAKGTPEAIANAKLQHEEQANNVLLHGASTEEETVGRIQKFNEDISMQGFMKFSSLRKQEVEKDLERVIKSFGLTEKQSIRARALLSSGADIERETFKSNIPDHISSIISTGKGFLNLREAERVLNPKEFKKLVNADKFAFQVHDAFRNIEFMNQSQMNDMLTFFKPESGEGFNEKQAVFEQLQRATLNESQDRQENRFENAARSVREDEFETTEDFVTAVVAMEKQKGAKDREIELTSQSQRDDFKSKWLAGNISQKRELRASLDLKYGKWRNGVIGELLNDNMNNAFNIIGDMTDNVAINEFLDAQQGVDETKKILGNNATQIAVEVNDLFEEGFGSTLPNLSNDERDSYRIPVENMALSLARKGISNPARQAINQVFDDHNTYANGLRYPKGRYNMAKQRQFLGEILEGKHIDLSSVVKDRTGTQISLPIEQAGPRLPLPQEFVQEFFDADFAANAVFVTNESGDGFVVYKDKAQLVQSDDGEFNRIEFKYDDIENAPVEVNDLLNKKGQLDAIGLGGLF